MKYTVIGILLLASSLCYGQPPAQPVLSGSWEQGGILIGTVPPASKVIFKGKAIPVGPKGEIVLGLGRNAAAQATLVIENPAGAKSRKTYKVKKRDYNIQRVTGVPQKTVTPPKARLQRIHKEAVEVWRARARQINATDFMATFQWPLIGPITGVYGSQRVYNGKPGRPHYGVDIARAMGTPVSAPAAGLVTLAEPDLFLSGGTLIIDHGQGLSSTFLHLSKILVKVGQRVAQGDIIAKVGSSGRATGPHLDWRMNWRGERVDPTTLVGPMPKTNAQ